MDIHRLIADQKTENHQQDQVFTNRSNQNIAIGFIKAKDEVKAEEEGKGFPGSGIVTTDRRLFHTNLPFPWLQPFGARSLKISCH